MANNRTDTKDFSNRALEMIMRDVLGSMEECLLETAYKNSKKSGFEIIEISPPKKSATTKATNGQSAEVLNFPSKTRACG